MKSKLGFAIVTSMEPEILILDEVFATGDQNFRKKSEARIKELDQNTTISVNTAEMATKKSQLHIDSKTLFFLVAIIIFVPPTRQLFFILLFDIIAFIIFREDGISVCFDL